MKVLDLFSGLGGWSAAFVERGHEVIRIELNEELQADIHADIRDVANDPDAFLGGWRPDVILASPPCQCFSVAGNFKHFHAPPSRAPKDEAGALALELVEATLALVAELEPKYWWMENPRGLLRKMPQVKGIPRVTVSYCKYGEEVMKPTDLWGRWPPSWRPRQMCSNGDPCHIRAPRGSRTGTQGFGMRKDENPEWRAHPDSAWSGPSDAQRRAVVPYDLSLAVCLAVEDPTPHPGVLEAFSGRQAVEEPVSDPSMYCEHGVMGGACGGCEKPHARQTVEQEESNGA